MVVRVSPNGEVEREGMQVEVGGNERYVPLCRKHFVESLRTGRCTGWRQGDGWAVRLGSEFAGGRFASDRNHFRGALTVAILLC